MDAILKVDKEFYNYLIEHRKDLDCYNDESKVDDFFCFLWSIDDSQIAKLKSINKQEIF